MDGIRGLDFSNFYNLTYWGLGLSLVLVIIILIVTDGNSDFLSPLIIATIIIAGGVEIYHSIDRQELAIKRYQKEQEKEADDKRIRNSRYKGCGFEKARQKADSFMKSNNFIIVQTDAPYYDISDIPNSYNHNCIADFRYVVKVYEFNQATGQTSIRNRLYRVNLSLQKFDYSYEFTYANIEDPSTKQSLDLLN